MDYPIYWEGKQSGRLHVSAIEGDTCFELSCDMPGIYRAWVEGESGKLLLGVMEDGRLRRRFSPHMTRAVGKTVCARLEKLQKSACQWRTVQEREFPGWQLPDSARCRRIGKGYELALPYREGDIFPLPTLFCFARICQADGKCWAVFRFNEIWEPFVEEK